jgi:hypothetical protein
MSSRSTRARSRSDPAALDDVATTLDPRAPVHGDDGNECKQVVVRRACCEVLAGLDENRDPVCLSVRDR